jgi:peptidoglycan/xylan/chitin deacetylase (PgdA/CDA1 family)
MIQYFKELASSVNKKNKHSLTVFNYHQIIKNFDPRFHNRGNVTQDIYFEKQIKTIKKMFHLISLEDGINMLEKGKIDQRSAAITFDDGDISLKNNALPILEKYNVPATFFINSAYLQSPIKACWFHVYQYILNSGDDKKKHLTNEMNLAAAKLRHTMDSEYYRKEFTKIEDLSYTIEPEDRFFVDEQFLESLDDKLFHIGLHGDNHQRFSMMPYEWQKHDLGNNINILSKYKAYRPIFAVPFGRPHDWNRDTIKVCLENNIHIVFANGGINTVRDIGYKRIPADGRNIKKLFYQHFIEV